MPGPEFFQTAMGRRFYEHDVPRIAESLEHLAAVVTALVTETQDKARKPTRMARSKMDKIAQVLRGEHGDASEMIMAITAIVEEV